MQLSGWYSVSGTDSLSEINIVEYQLIIHRSTLASCPSVLAIAVDLDLGLGLVRFDANSVATILLSGNSKFSKMVC